ncbi:RAM signaling network component [Maudiozyma exigua]|uniref:RAM signaling network component n=1 Tax=Maudiozyma exigua TaxID=34358 RepID=A0A9P6WEM3_MAUEX|nr:RAM signaling network component [Kazachstania exigua]
MLPSVSHVNNDTSRKISTDNQKIESPIAAELARQAASGTSQSTIKLVGLDIKTITSDDIQQIQNVDRLSLRKNQLVALPKCFGNLRNLRYLDLNSNNLRDIPHILQQCPQLEILDLSCNKIKTLPLDISSYWSQNLKVLSLKNNRLTSINDLRIILSLPKLNVLEIENNNIPKEELDMVQNYTPVTTTIPKDEYWAAALRRYFEDHPEKNIIPTSSALSSSSSVLSASASVSSLNQDNNSKLSRASKRMGFINTTRNGTISSPMPHSPKQSTTESSSHQPMDNNPTPNNRRPPHHTEENVKSNNSIVSNLSLPTPTAQTSLTHSPNSSSHGHNASGTELYNHTKYNDYFKRLSILPEETMVNEETKISKAELVAACRKLLFGFTECQQAVRKIASFCKDSSIAVNIVSLLYSVRTHIDSLVEILREIENDESSNDQGLIKICITIISSFKQIITVLRKNFTTFFEEDDLCFIRMFYMTLLCSYTEIYNAWSFISTEFHSKKARLQRKYPLKKEDSSVLSFVASSSVVSSSHNKSTIAEEKNPFEQNLANFNNSKHNIRVRSNTLQSKMISNLPSTLVHTNSSNSDSSFNSTAMNEQVTSEHPLAQQQQQNKGNTADSILRSRSTDNSPSSQHNVHVQDMSRSASIHKIQRSESVAERDRLSSSPANNSMMRKTSISTQHPSVLKSSNSGHKKAEFKNKTDIGSEIPNTEPRSMSEVDRSQNNSGNDATVHGAIVMQRGDSNNSGPIVSETTEKRSLDHSAHSGNQVIVEATTNGEAEQNIDRQLYEMLINVTRMVSVVYDQLTNEISRIAMASTTGQQKLTDELLLRIRGLTDTCCQALDLSKTLNERLQLLVNDDPSIVEPFLTDTEKLITWENINAFLKSIISILGSTKVVMTDLPNLNEIRPHLASLAKITKDVTVILDLSSYKAVSVTASQIQKQQQQQQQQQVQIQQQQQLQQQQINSHTHVPLLTPQPMTNNSTNGYPFDQ